MSAALASASWTTALATDAGAPQWVMLLPMGVITPRDGRGPWLLENLEHARQVVAASLSAAGSTDLVFDYDHQTVFAAKDGVGGQAPAAGWIKALEARVDGIWARVEWTPTAAERLSRREYRYVSPFFFHQVEGGRIIRIANASLVNTPAIRELPAVAKDQSMDSATQVLAQLRAVFGLADSAPPDAIVEAARTAVSGATASVDPAKFVPMEVFEQVTADLNRASRGVSAEAAAIVVDREIAAGRLMPALKEWGVSLCSENKPAFDAFLERTSAGAQQLFEPRSPRSHVQGGAAPLDEEIARNLGLKA